MSESYMGNLSKVCRYSLTNEQSSIDLALRKDFYQWMRRGCQHAEITYDVVYNWTVFHFVLVWVGF